MSRIVLLIALVAGVILYLDWKKKGVSPNRILIRFATITVIGVALFLALTGKMHWVGVAFAALLPTLRGLFVFLLKYFPMLHQLTRQLGIFSKKPFSQAQSNTSKVSSAVLVMELDHATGDLDGQIVQGEFQGKLLSQLTEVQIESLLGYCQQIDQESVDLLYAYIDRRFGARSWQGASQSSDKRENGNGTNRSMDSEMSEEEALALLGLEKGADKQAITDAHRKLMQKVHPDRGGNDYLAAKINQAKDFLINL